jgi:predicted secreted protein
MRALLVPIAIALAGCSATQTAKLRDYFNLTPPVMATDARVDGQSLPLKRGQVIVVRLDEDPSSGLRWEMQPLASGAVIAPVHHDYTSSAGSDPATVGVPGEATFRFRGVTSGTQPVVLEYKRPFEPAAQKTIRFDLVVE